MDTPGESDYSETHSCTHTDNIKATEPNKNEPEEGDNLLTHTSTLTDNTTAAAPNRNEPEEGENLQTHSSTQIDNIEATALDRNEKQNPNQPNTEEESIFPKTCRLISEPGPDVVLHRGERKRSACISLDTNSECQDKNKKRQAVAETSVGKNINCREDASKTPVSTWSFCREKSSVSIRQENSKKSSKERFQNMNTILQNKARAIVRSTKSDLSGWIPINSSFPKTSQNAILCTSKVLKWLLLLTMLTMSSLLQACNICKNISVILKKVNKGNRMSTILVKPDLITIGKPGKGYRLFIKDLFPELFYFNRFAGPCLTVYAVPFYGSSSLELERHRTREVIQRILQGQERGRYLRSEAFRLATFGLDTCVYHFHRGETMRLARDGYFCDVEGQIRCCECYCLYVPGAVHDHRRHCLMRPGYRIGDYGIQPDTVMNGLARSSYRIADYSIRSDAVLLAEDPVIDLQEVYGLSLEMITALPGLRRGQGTTLDDSSEAGDSGLIRFTEANINISNENETNLARTATEVIAPRSVSSRCVNVNQDDPMNMMYDNWESFYRQAGQSVQIRNTNNHISLSLTDNEPENSEELPFPDNINEATRECNIPSVGTEGPLLEMSEPLDRQSDIGAVGGTHLQSDVQGSSVSQTLVPNTDLQTEKTLTVESSVQKYNNGREQKKECSNRALKDNISAISEEQQSPEDINVATKQSETASSTEISLPTTLNGESDIGAVGSTQPTSNIQGNSVPHTSVPINDLKTDRTVTGYADSFTQNGDKGCQDLASDYVVRLSPSQTNANIVNQQIYCDNFQNTRTLSDCKCKESNSQQRTQKNRPVWFLSNRNNTEPLENGATFDAGKSGKASLDKRDLSKNHTDNSLVNSEQDIVAERSSNNQERDIQNIQEGNEGTDPDDTEDKQAEPEVPSSASGYEPM